MIQACLLYGEEVDKKEFENENLKITKDGGKAAQAVPGVVSDYQIKAIHNSPGGLSRISPGECGYFRLEPALCRSFRAQYIFFRVPRPWAFSPAA